VTVIPVTCSITNYAYMITIAFRLFNPAYHIVYGLYVGLHVTPKFCLQPPPHTSSDDAISVSASVPVITAHRGRSLPDHIATRIR